MASLIEFCMPADRFTAWFIDLANSSDPMARLANSLRFFSHCATRSRQAAAGSFDGGSVIMALLSGGCWLTEMSSSRSLFAADRHGTLVCMLRSIGMRKHIAGTLPSATKLARQEGRPWTAAALQPAPLKPRPNPL